VRVFVSAALDEYDFFDVVKLGRSIFEGVSENATVEGFERGKISK